MILKVQKSKTSGRIKIPGSKSHTIRAFLISSLANGRSEIKSPLVSNDALSAVEVCKALGAQIESYEDGYAVNGFNGLPQTPDDVVNVGNSGTTLRFCVSTAALGDGCSVFTGDYQIRRRPLGPLIEALNNLGANVLSVKNNNMAPVIVRGRLKGGRTNLDSITSQYLSSLLINLPLCERDSEIFITQLNEVPYVEMTMWWLNRHGIIYSNDNFRSILIKGNQSYKPFSTVIPGDFSSATFFMALSAISGGEFTLENLDMSDPQGDKLVLSILEDMGAKVVTGENNIIIKGSNLSGREIDMNSIPDALPAMAVVGCFAQGETKLLNVPQARLKETDRIHVMCKELKKMGADIEELADGLIIRQSRLKGCTVEGHDDHRVVMALAVAGLNIEGETIINGAEAMNVTFPNFVELINSCGGTMTTADKIQGI